MLKGKITLITGAGSGLGKDIAIGLASEGAEVILVGRREPMLKQTLEAIEREGGKAALYVTNVTDKDEVNILAQHVLEKHGVPAMLVNSAGTYGEISTIADSNPDIWIHTLMTNTAGSYLICRAFVGAMVKEGWGRIVNITSAASLSKPNPKNSAYAVSKAALNLFTRQLAAEVQGTGVTANVLHPGEVMTEMFDTIRATSASSGDMTGWVQWVQQTGGDSPDKTVRRILDLTKPESSEINGQFLWIKDGLKQPLPSWEVDDSLQ
ncbi:SDR family NAD(P)-dependent oxidoreductase [Paenibacillus cremeus]|uniref:SDR family oxidoreductase n=1 Tax=Paenibacillus cremeus TaxID=2163881 RepID=A0A559KH07_9BACL|nr:SDR family oxidoreductase [Paenibacillus cremeus]TVY11396.1 SDR family oxidoreductase [Paenibacillus cremeus]